MRSFTPSPGFARLWVPLVGLALVAALAVPAIYWAERSSLVVWSRKTERFISKEPVRHIFQFEGLGTPATISAAKATLADDEPVIGIEAAGKFRAYHERSMSGKTRHVLNDVLGGKAVTVTYCDIADCARAYGGVEQSGPLNIALAGLDAGGMLLSVGNVVYYQKTAEIADPVRDKAAPPFPHASFPLTRTTWGEWKSRHPETDVFVHDAPKTPDR
ncbi:MAG: DUF3179 domain-containing (seleno)protein [Paludisphaera borealis]|uniref:DUF3179 domain-containing (seleno)protein n=1 Tax=Paludisphaera borealis TaxID=1387353 RepID=UPI0028405387|nr:DUF3179 domain-containing (seleno)protein [Paludisphaera borealis]MDR3620075.1 DUF3179 domain-containing (seleno)protein [Paludisphaera borealis]